MTKTGVARRYPWIAWVGLLGATVAGASVSVMGSLFLTSQETTVPNAPEASLGLTGSPADPRPLDPVMFPSQASPFDPRFYASDALFVDPPATTRLGDMTPSFVSNPR